MKKKTGLVLSMVILCFITWMLIPACTGGSASWRAEKIDSLALVLKDCEAMMDHDRDELRRRVSRITTSVNKLQRFASDTFTHDFIRSIDQYMAAQKIYNRYLDNIPEMFIELNALKTQLLSLKKTSDDGNITDEQFKKFIHNERVSILKLHEICEEIAEPLDKLEPMYLRSAPRIEAFSDSLAKISGY